MKNLLVLIVLFFSFQTLAAPTAVSNDVEMDEIQEELMKEIDTATVEDEEFLDQNIEATPAMEEKIQLEAKKTPAKKTEVKQVSKTTTTVETKKK